MNVGDDLYLGNFNGPQALTQFSKTASANPTVQIGVGPMGRTLYFDVVPVALGTTNLAAAQAQTSGTALTLTAGAGVTAGSAPDGSGATVFAFDTPRAVSLTSGANLSAGNFTVTGYDQYGAKMSQTLAGPNINTVNTLKAFASVLSIVPGTTSASTASAGTSDIFGLPVAVGDAGYIVSAKWASVLAQNAGTLTVAATTNPATASTGDVRGTFAQSGVASNGANRLVVGIHLTNAQCGSAPTVAAVLGVTQA